MENIDEIKRTWQNMNERISRLEAENRKQNMEMIRSRSRTSRDRLLSYYKRFMAMGVLGIIIFILFFTRSEILEPRYTFPVVTYFVVYFCICILMDLWLYRRMSGINLYRDTLAEVARKTLYARRWHQKFVIILVPLALLGVFLLIFCMIDNQELLYGLILGAIVGSFIGIWKYRRMMRDYREIEESATFIEEDS